MTNLPLIGLGTWQLRGKECREIVGQAIEIGYRHIDTAFSYENHREVGQGIASFPREELFLTSKFTIEQLREQKKPPFEAIASLIDRALKELNTDYLDLLLIHWPNREAPLEAILEAMQKHTEGGKLRFAGVSNYTQHHLQDAYDAGLKVAYNQVEFHPHLYQKELLAFCKAHQTQLIAYRPFGKGTLLANESLLIELAQKKNKTPAQVVLRWIIQKGIPVVPKASSIEHLKQNLSLDFSLSPEEEALLDRINKNKRYCQPDATEFNY